MAMKPLCAEAVQRAAEAAGLSRRTEAQIDAIDSRLRSTMRELARTDPEWRGKSADQRLGEATAKAMQDIQGEASRKLANAHLQVVKTAAVEGRIEAAHAKDRTHALVEDLDKTNDYISGVKAESMGRMMAFLNAAKSGEGTTAGRRVAQFLFDADNPQMTRDLANEIFRNADGSTGNKTAQIGAKTWLETSESLRQRFNAAGGDVGKIDYGYLAQPWEADRVRSAGAEKFAEKIAPYIDRDRMLREDGARMSDAEVSEFLRDSWETIATDGLNKTEPGAFKGSGARANRGSEHREIHFKDGESWLAAMRDFGRGSLYDAIGSHLGRMSRDIGLVERYGPNPNAQFRLQNDLAMRADKGTERVFGMKATSYWDVVSGVSSTPESALIARVGSNARNVQTFTKLGGAVISSITDLGTHIVTTGYNKLSYWDAFKNYGRVAAKKEWRDMLTSHGVIAEAMAGDLNRWTGENVSRTWSGKLAQSTLKLSLLNAWTDTLRRSFQLTMMQALARMSRKDWASLSQWDRGLMERRGITEADWQVLQKAEPTKFNGVDHITPTAIRETGSARSNEVVSKVLGMIQDEGEFAVINPDLATKTAASLGGLQRGTVKGEFARSVMQFKSFPLAMVSRHWRRMLDAPKVTDGSAPALANRGVYLGALLLSTTALGAITFQAKQIVAGKDPVDMIGPHAAKFWAQSLAQGGGLSILGDMLLSNSNDSSVNDWTSATIKTLLGPTSGQAFDAISLVKTNIDKRLKGQVTHTAAESLAYAKGMAPLVNLWYLKAAVDHMGLHALQENLSPGYLSKMQQRANKDWGEQYWWRPGTGGPQQAPNMSKAIGR